MARTKSTQPKIPTRVVSVYLPVAAYDHLIEMADRTCRSVPKMVQYLIESQAKTEAYATQRAAMVEAYEYQMANTADSTMEDSRINPVMYNLRG